MRFRRREREESRRRRMHFLPRIFLRILLSLAGAVFVFYLIVFITGWI